MFSYHNNYYANKLKGCFPQAFLANYTYVLNAFYIIKMILSETFKCPRSYYVSNCNRPYSVNLIQSYRK